MVLQYSLFYIDFASSIPLVSQSIILCHVFKTKAGFGLIHDSSPAVSVLYIPMITSYFTDVIVHPVLPTCLLPQDVLFIALKTNLVFSRRSTCLSQCICLVLHMGMISVSLHLSLSSLLFKILHVFFLRWGHKIFLKSLFSNVYSAL